MKWIEDYAIIGDCRSAALVSREGSIDWLCWPQFDSPSIFGALLDERAGCWKIAPAGRFDAERRYVENTNVLQTRFQTVMGSLLVTDLMPVTSEDEKRRTLQPEHEILRIVECDAGQVEVEMVFDAGRNMAGRGSAFVTPASSVCVWKCLRVSSCSGQTCLWVAPSMIHSGLPRCCVQGRRSTSR